MATTIATLQGVLTLDDSQFTGGLRNARTGLSGLGTSLQNTGAKITRFGIGASIALAPVTLALKSSVSAFRDFDVAMTNSQAILGATADEMELLTAQVLDIGGASRAGPQAAAEAFFTIVSGVQDATTHMDILNSSIALSEAGLADLAITTDGMVAVMNSYRFAAEDAQFVSDVFTRTVQMGVGTMDEFVGALSPLASLANELGISFEELAGAEALLTSQGRSASDAATQLQSTMVAFIRPNQAMTDALALMGFESGQAAIETLGLQGAVDALSAALDDDVGAMTEALGRTEALQGSLVLAGEGAEEFLDKFKGGVDGATEAARELQNQTDTAISDLFMSRVDELQILLGEQLSGALADVQEALTPLVEDIIAWAEENPETVKQITLMALALVGLAGGLIVVGGLVTALGVGLSALTSPIVLVGLGIGALVLILSELFGFDFGDLKAVAINTFERMEFWAGKVRDIINDLVGLLNDVSKAVQDVAGFLNIGQGGRAQALLTQLQERGVTIPQRPSIPPPDISNIQTENVLINSLLNRFRGRPGAFAGGGDFEAFQPMRVGEEGPETVMFPQAGTVIPNRQSMGGMFEGAIFNIFANDEAGGRAAGKGLRAELGQLLVRNG